MKNAFNSRRWHIWISVILSLPILIVGVTTFFIAHKKSLGTDEIRLAAEWLPGYRGEAARAVRNEARVAFSDASGTVWIGTNGGLFRLRDGNLEVVPALAGIPVRGLAEAPWGRVAAAKNGIWVGSADGDWRRAHKGDAWSAAPHRDGAIVVALKDQGLLLSTDGRRWAPDAAIGAALAALPAEAAEPMTLARLMIDLHTGKAFFGKAGEWIWIDLVGFAMCLLALTGVYMWWRGERRKAALRG